MNKTQAIVFFGIIVIGVITSIFILSKNGPTSQSSSPAPPSKSAVTAKPSVSASKPKGKETKPSPAKSMTKTKSKPSPPEPAAKKAPVKPAGGFASEKALMNALSKAIQNKKPDLFFELAGPNSLSPSTRAHLAGLLKKGGLKIDPKQALSAIGRTQNSTRWALRLLSSSNEKIEILTDLGKNSKGAWKVLKMRTPVGQQKTMSAGNSAGGAEARTGPSGETGEHPDAMMVAHAFSKAAIARDIKTARALSDPKRLNNEKLAALLIALEEGEFRLKTDKPLVVTLSRDDLTWAITRVESGQEKSEFGVEMNLAKDGRWTVSGLTFSKLISMTAMAAGAGDVAYSPIRKSPKGGDSLVLYFEFDNEQVSTRTRKQLTIVAGILAEDKNRKLHINGHADAKGDDNYNVALSKRRTAAVRNTLIELGVASGQIVTKAFGETMPLKPNFKPDGSDNPTGRAQNRRTEIYLDF